MLRYFVSTLLLATFVLTEHSPGYTYVRNLLNRPQFESTHAQIARKLVHQANWAAVGTISTDSKILGYPMVNIISIDDNNEAEKSTGLIHFLLTDLDFTGHDWRANNKVTFFFTDEQNLNCAKRNIDPMEPTCARTMISGQVLEMKKDAPEYIEYLNAFIRRHPRAKEWLKVHSFYLCELEIKHIYVMDFYGPPREVELAEYLKAYPDDDDE